MSDGLDTSFDVGDMRSGCGNAKLCLCSIPAVLDGLGVVRPMPSASGDMP